MEGLKPLTWQKERIKNVFVSREGKIYEQTSDGLLEVECKLVNNRLRVPARLIKKRWTVIPLHLAVASHFLGVPYRGIEFADGDVTNCHVDNLIPITGTYVPSLRGSGKSCNNDIVHTLTKDDIDFIRRTYTPSTKEALAKQFNLPGRVIYVAFLDQLTPYKPE